MPRSIISVRRSLWNRGRFSTRKNKRLEQPDKAITTVFNGISFRSQPSHARMARIVLSRSSMAMAAEAINAHAKRIARQILVEFRRHAL